MQPELLLCDIGNTSIKIGFATKSQVLGTYALPVNKRESGDNLGLALVALCQHAKADIQKLEACVACSVVPGLDAPLAEAVSRYLFCPLFFAPKDLPIPLENSYERPQEVGADRLVGAYAARRLKPDIPSLIVVDYGTAVTFDCISHKAYLGGLIFPGPATAVAALAGNTAKLPAISLECAEELPSPGRDTATSIQHGLIFGFQAVTEGLCAKLASQMEKPLKIIATGGFANAMARLTGIFDALAPTLLLDGLRLLYSEKR